MTGRVYDDFPIRMTNPVETAAGLTFEVSVGADLMRQDEAAKLTFVEAEFWGDAGLLRDFDSNPEIDSEVLFAAGGRLADMAIPEGRVRDLFRQRRQRAQGAGRSLRIRLMVEIPQLQLLPWEFIHLRQQPGSLVAEDFLALDPDYSIVRSEILWDEVPKAPHAGAVRFVGMLSDPTEQKTLELHKDRDAIEAAIDSLREEAKAELVDLVWTETNTRSALGEALGRQAEVFHYSGHGAFDSSVDGGQGQLILQQPDGKLDHYPESLLATDLGGADVRLAVLGACNTARRDSYEAWSGLALRLIRQGIPAVIGNQFRIRNSSAKTFNTHFYLHLLGGTTVDEAMTLARIAVRREKSIEWRDWGVPVLHLGATGGVLFDLAASAAGRLAAHPVDTEVAKVDARRAASRAQRSSPYRGVRPFGRDDEGVFFGRDGITAEILDQIHDGSDITVVQGEAGVGKTSLIEAGVTASMPGPVVRLEEYSDFPRQLSSAAQGAGMGNVHANGGVADVVAGLASHRETALVILDQFERTIDLDPVDDKDDLAAITTLVRALVAAQVPVVLCTRDHALGKLEEWLTGVSAANIERIRVNRLLPAEARAAVREPLGDGPVQIDDEVLEWIISDLDEQREDDLIDPTELQIVCESLFYRARDRALDTGGNLRIDSGLYEKGGAAQIISEHLEDQIERYFADDRESAESLMLSILSARTGEWVDPGDLRTAGVQGEKLSLMLHRLETSGFLVKRRRKVSEYALASPAVKHAVLDWAGPEARRVHRAHGVLDGITADWEARKVLPRGSQVDFLASIERLRPSTQESLLLLRAAIREGRETRPWVQRLRQHPELAAKLETVTGEGAGSELAVFGLDVGPGTAGRVALTEAALAPCPEPEPADAIGDRAEERERDRRHRIECRDRRAAAALTLASLPDGSGQLVTAIAAGDVDDGIAGEIWGALLDADPESAQQLNALKGSVRRRANWDRTRRLMRRDGRDIVRLGIGGATGAGLGMGLWRAILTPATSGRTNAWATEFAFTFVWAAVLAFGLVVAAAFATTVWPPGTRRRSRLQPYVAATAGFGSAMLLVALANGLSLTSRYSIAIAGFVAGAALSPVPITPSRIWPWPKDDRLPHGALRAGLLTWIGVVAVVFALVQGVLMMIDGLGAALPIVRAPDFWGPSLAAQIDVFAGKSEGLFKWIAAGDAAVVGVLLTSGTRSGVRRAAAAIAARKELEAGNVD